MSHPAAAPTSPSASRPEPPPGLDTQELRIAPVLVGGVSLAVWMGGLMCELERLTRARSGDRPSVYGRLTDLMDVQVNVDVLSGTSAGGINAAAFALARRRGGSVAALRDLWLRVGSFEDLLRSPYEKEPPSLMRGDEVMLTELFAAFTGMQCDAQPNTGPLTLFLTGTYLRGELSQYRDDYGTLISDVNHAALFRFNADQLRPPDRERSLPPDPGGDTAAAALALAARTSASFPYAFEPSYLPLTAKPGAAADPMHPLMGDYSDGTVDHLAVDGGALANRPLGPALQAIFEQTADREVRRVVAYITPTTSATVVQPTDSAMPRLGKAMAQTVGAMLNQSISSDLSRLRQHNQRVGSIHRSRVQLATLALAGADIAGPPAWQAYLCQRAQREGRALLEQATRQVRGASLQGRVPAGWAADVDNVQATPRGWTETLEAQRLQLLHTDLAGAEQDTSRPPIALGVELFEDCHAAVLPLFRAVLGLLRARGQWRAVEDLHTHRVALRAARSATARPESASAYASMRSAVSAVEQLPQPGSVTDFLAGVAASWPPRPPDAVLADAWRELVGLVRSLADRLDDTLPREAAAPGPGQPLDANEEQAQNEARPMLDYLMRGLSASPDADGRLAWRLAALVVGQEALCGRDVIDQRVELIQMSADTRTRLLLGADGRYARCTAAQKLTGLQLHHFGAFYKSAWRANDWMWGRLDGAGWLVHVLLDPRRIRQRFASADGFVAALERHGLLAGPFVQGPLPPEVRADIDAAFGAHPPVALPNLALFVAAAAQAEIAADELPVLARQIEQDRRDGLVESRDRAFLGAVDTLGTVPSGSPEHLVAAAEALRACATGTEKIAEDAGSPRFVTTVSSTAAMVAATLDSAVAKPPGPIARLTKSLRSLTLTVFVMAKGLKRAGPLGLLAGVAIAVAGAADGWAQTTAISISALLLLLLLTVGLRYGENRRWPDVAIVGAAVAALTFTALAGLWPEPVKNWPWDGVQAAVRWLQPRWWATAIVLLAALAWLLLPVLRAQVTHQRSKRKAGVAGAPQPSTTPPAQRVPGPPPGQPAGV